MCRNPLCLILLLVVFFVAASPTLAQFERTEKQITITTESSEEYTVSYSSMGLFGSPEVTISGEGISMSFEVNEHAQDIGVQVWVGDGEYWDSPTSMSGSQPSGFGLNPFEDKSMDSEVIDLSVLDTEDRDLWESAMLLTGKLITNSEFKDFLAEVFIFESDGIYSSLGNFHSGYFVPTTYESYIGLSFSIGQDYSFNQYDLVRTYYLSGINTQLGLATLSPPDDPTALVRLTSYADWFPPINRIEIDPLNESCVIFIDIDELAGVDPNALSLLYDPVITDEASTSEDDEEQYEPWNPESGENTNPYLVSFESEFAAVDAQEKINTALDELDVRNYDEVFSQIIDFLGYFQDQMPSFKEHGMVEESSDIDLILDIVLEGLGNYEVEMEQYSRNTHAVVRAED